MPGQEKQFQWITRKGRIDIGQIIFKITSSISHGMVTLFLCDMDTLRSRAHK